MSSLALFEGINADLEAEDDDDLDGRGRPKVVPGDPLSILRTVEEFATGKGQWLKVAGGKKSELIEYNLRHRLPREHEFVLEFGTFIGYSAIRMSRIARPCIGRSQGIPKVVSLELDPIHALIARQLLELSHLHKVAEVWIGQARDTISRLLEEWGERCLKFAFMDHRGTKFHEDLQQCESLEALGPDFRIVADNVLKPGAPLYMWHLVTPGRGMWNAQMWSLPEFVQDEAEDWMVVADFHCGAAAPTELVKKKGEEDQPLGGFVWREIPHPQVDDR